jgi:hypothetical protein
MEERSRPDEADERTKPFDALLALPGQETTSEQQGGAPAANERTKTFEGVLPLPREGSEPPG